MADALLELTNVGVELGGRQVLHGVNVSLSAGERLLVLGPNGAGKSTLLRVMHQLLAPTVGSVRIAAAARRQAMVFQRPAMLRCSARANVEYALPLPRAERAERARGLLARAGLAEASEVPATRLSFGQQQRVALCRAWAIAPQVLFLDEPTASLDPASCKAVEGLIQEIHAGDVPIVMTTHNLPQARRLATVVLFLTGGRVGELTPADEFFVRPRSPEARAFLEDESL